MDTVYTSSQLRPGTYITKITATTQRPNMPHILVNNRRPVFTQIKVKKKTQVPNNLLNPEQV